MTTREALTTLRSLGRKVRRLPSGRYKVQGVWPCVREEDLITIARGLEARK